jgi:polar amino acid transport system substrate-binding protein
LAPRRPYIIGKNSCFPSALRDENIIAGTPAHPALSLWPVRQTVYDRRKNKDRASGDGRRCVMEIAMSYPSAAIQGRIRLRRAIVAIAAWVALACSADDKLVRLVSLDWQPYAGATLPEQGAAAAVVKAAFQAVDYSVDVDFYPWARAVHLTESANEYDGIFPVYYSAVRARWLNCSTSIGRSPLGFAERSKAPVAWATLDDLHAYKIGVVRDYVNTERFDSMVAAGRIAVDVVSSDTQNLQKLAHGRIDLAVIDRNVMEQLLKGPAFQSEPELAALQFNRRVLENQDIYICFKRNEAGDRISAAFAAGLRRIDAEAITARYLRDLGSPPGASVRVRR